MSIIKSLTEDIKELVQKAGYEVDNLLLVEKI